MICIDDFIEKKNIDFLDILHSDIQGYEFKMLIRAEELLEHKKAGYIFLSTHSNEIHYKYLDYLRVKGFILICSHDLLESYSEDGLLFFKNPDYKETSAVTISKRKRIKK